MCFRAHTPRRAALQNLASSSATYQPVRYITKRFHPRFTVNISCASARTRLYHCAHYRPAKLPKRSGSGLFTAVVVFGIAVGGAILFPLLRNTPKYDIEKAASSPPFNPSDFTDSFLVMAPNTPPGRPGTLTPEQESKLREMWTATLRMFGEYELAAADVNGTESPAVSSEASSEKDVKKDKKKSRLNVFKRNKGDKEDKSGSTPSSGTVTPSDISSLSIADDDDKHGQTKQAKAALANMSPDDLRTAFWSMVKLDHPDALLLRFLRARKWDVEKALVMMISTMHWRLEEMHVDDDIIKNGEESALRDSKSSDPKVKKEAEDFLTQLRIGKSYLHGLDGEGRPMCIVRARLHHGGEQSESSLERFTVFTIETARMFLRPPVDTATIIFDMTDFTMANMDYAPVKFMTKCFEANYPESLGTVLVYKAPWVFNAIWNIIRGWLDPVVAGKVHFVKNVDELQKFVPMTQIPAELGGDEKFAYEYPEPVEGENAKMAEEGPRLALQDERAELVKRYLSRILEWVVEGDKGKGLEERRRERDEVAEQLKQNYWKLDPYVRARTLYDRIGLLGEGGAVTFYPKAKVAEKENLPPAQETSPDDLD
ncbi:hypothetical protein K458DRAFT_364347 [Lentithecium fluviatile CBS 122367]|uniref:CRAL-TRIO domain-containing protein n=1 Tax=Lentithecium fluviatile CBS 122367 TaxID=1168545 RepID=A0A6G1J4R9_9PLEO|nr:hypothetical protein K458DRAFT_364347 [Lentithecium fluviatile CBS 122367]